VGLKVTNSESDRYEMEVAKQGFRSSTGNTKKEADEEDEGDGKMAPGTIKRDSLSDPQYLMP